MASFEEAHKYVSPNEGGFVNHPNDPGGATNWGITRAVLSQWRKHSVSIQDMRDLTKTEAHQIYKAWYWDPLNLSWVHEQGIATAIYDQSVNRGVGEAPRMAQRACNACGAQLVVDGHLGPKSLEVLNTINPADFIETFERIVETAYIGLAHRNSKLRVFLKGWLNRAHRLLSLIKNKAG